MFKVIDFVNEKILENHELKLGVSFALLIWVYGVVLFPENRMLITLILSVISILVIDALFYPSIMFTQHRIAFNTAKLVLSCISVLVAVQFGNPFFGIIVALVFICGNKAIFQPQGQSWAWALATLAFAVPCKHIYRSIRNKIQLKRGKVFENQFNEHFLFFSSLNSTLRIKYSNKNIFIIHNNWSGFNGT